MNIWGKVSISTSYSYKSIAETLNYYPKESIFDHIKIKLLTIKKCFLILFLSYKSLHAKF